MPYCYSCGKKISKAAEFCPSCGTKMSVSKSIEKKGNDTLRCILILLGLGGLAVGLFLLVGGLIAVIMNPFIEDATPGGHVWAIGYLVWLIFYPTGLINSCFLVGITCFVVGIGAFVLEEIVS